MDVSKNRWLLFLPQLPSSPSSLRVQAWRRLRAAGATALQNGVWVLSHTSENERLFRELLKEVENQHGSGFLLEASPMDEAINQEIVERFRSDRDQEYSEFWERCQEFLAEIEKESAREKFTFAELEENEDDLHKLTGWLRKIQARDSFKGHRAVAATEVLEECQKALKTFARAVYSHEGLAADDNNGSEEANPKSQ